MTDLVTILASAWTHAVILTALCFWTYWRAKAPQERRQADWFMGAALFNIPLNLSCHAAAGALSPYRPLKLDAWAFTIDSHLGNASFVIGRLVHGTPWLLQASMASYDLLAVASVLAFGVTVWFRPQDARAAAITLIAYIAFLPICYYLVPMCGPGYAFASFPQLPRASVALATMTINAAPNCMPSGHFAGALLFAWYLRHWLAGRLVGIAFLVMTFLATLGLGEHYLIDLIAAVPYAALILWLGNTVSRRREALEYPLTNASYFGYN